MKKKQEAVLAKVFPQARHFEAPVTDEVAPIGHSVNHQLSDEVVDVFERAGPPVGAPAAARRAPRAACLGGVAQRAVFHWMAKPSRILSPAVTTGNQQLKPCTPRAQRPEATCTT